MILVEGNSWRMYRCIHPHCLGIYTVYTERGQRGKEVTVRNKRTQQKNARTMDHHEIRRTTTKVSKLPSKTKKNLYKECKERQPLQQQKAQHIRDG
jgi:hypothetical protein